MIQNLDNSPSKVKIKFEINGDKRLEAELYIHLAPSLVTNIIKKKILYGRLFKQNDSYVYSPIDIISGVERKRTKFERGEIAFISSTGSMCIFLKETELKMPFTPIGKIITNAETLEEIQQGNTLKVEII